MNFFPSKVEFRQLTLAHDELMHRFSSLVKSENESHEQQFLFQGAWGNDRFSISQILKIPNRFTPVIDGEIVVSDNEIRLNMRFSLSKSTKRRLLIYTVVPLALSAFFILGYNAWLYGSITFGFGFVNYILTREHFAAQVKKSQHALKRLFSTN